MARTGSQLRVSFVVDTGGLRSGFSKATRETDRFGKASQRSARSTNVLGTSLRRAALAAGTAAAAYLSIAQAKAAIETTQELALTTKGLQRNLGLATREASRWAAVTRARGVDSKTLTMSFTALSRAIDGTRTGTESALRPFQALGITQKELAATGGNFQKQILLVSDALGKAEGSSTRQAAAAKLLGRGYRDILPLFADGAKGLQEQLRWADEFGATMGKKTVDAMSDFTTAQRRGRVAIMGLQIAFARFATPAITDVLNHLGDLAAVLNDPNLSKAAKLTRLREEFGKLQDRVIAIIGDLVPMVAQSAGEVGVALAQGIARGFQETGLLGKLAISAFFIKAMGGPRAILAAGTAVGAIYSRGIAIGTANVNAFKNAKSLGYGTLATSGALASSIAGNLAKSLARFIPMAMAAFAIGDVVLTALAGDMKSAAYKGGGAAIGAAIGALFGPAGIAIGAGLGAIGGDLIKGIVSGAEDAVPTYAQRLAASVGRLASAADKEKAAYRQLQSASKFVVDSRNRQKSATDRVRVAERNLARARARFGPNSEQAIQAENRLARAKNSVARATQRVKAAERVHGALRKATISDIRASVKEQKRELFTLQVRKRRLEGLINSGRADLDQKRAYINISKAVDKGQANLNKSYQEAAQKVGPKFANSLARISGKAQALKRDVMRLKTGVVVNSRGMSRTYINQLDAMLKKTSTSVQFLRSDGRITTIGAGGPSGPQNSGVGPLGPQRRRRGGLISGAGKRVVAAVSPGEMITHRGREMMVPGRPEPRDSVLMSLPVGAKVYTYDGQARLAMGASPAQALRDQAPHFAAGGIVRPEMVGGLPAQRNVANKGFGKVYKEAIAYYRRNSLTDLASVVRLAAKFGLSVSSGYRPGDTGSYHAVNRARDFAGDPSDMYRFAKFLGTRFGGRLLELIYSPLGWSIDNYQRTAPYAVADHYDHVHVAMRKGGRVRNINRIWNEHNAGNGDWGGPTLPSYVVAALAEAAGMPGKTMEQVTRGESGAHAKGTARPGATGIDPGGTKGHGLWMITSGFNEDLARKAGGWRNMLNPVVNAWAAAQIYRRQGLGAWYGTGSVTGDGQHYNGSYDIRNALGGLSFKGALYLATGGKLGEEPKAIDRMTKSANRLAHRSRSLQRSGGSRGFLKAARRNTERAKDAAKSGDIIAAERFLNKAREQIGKAGTGSPKNTGKKPPKVTTTGSVGQLLREAGRKGISRDLRESLLSNALSVAQETGTTDDDLLVLTAQRQLQNRIRKSAEAKLRETNRKLKRPGLSKKERRKLRGQRNAALENLGASSAEIASINSQIGDAAGGGETAADLATSMKELADAIKEQNELAKSVQAVSSREALKMLSDVISGQIVGKRLNGTPTPIGVRY